MSNNVNPPAEWCDPEDDNDLIVHDESLGTTECRHCHLIFGHDEDCPSADCLGEGYCMKHPEGVLPTSHHPDCPRFNGGSLRRTKPGDGAGRRISAPVQVVLPGDPWPPAISDGLILSCHDCGEVPRFDYTVEEDFWARWVPGPERLGVICLPCLDRRCGGEGLGEALIAVQWTGTGHTAYLVPERVYQLRRRPGIGTGRREE